MQKLTKIFYCNVALLLLVLLLIGRTGGTNEESKTDALENTSASQPEKTPNDTEESSQIDKNGDESESTKESEETATDDSNEINETGETFSEETRNEDLNNTSNSEANNPLSKYSSKEIEYARVWRQLGPNQDLEYLFVNHIPAGTPLDPEHDTGVSYPEDVIQLTGTRIVDGIVTYSGNGDGTINVYNIPRRWYGGFSPPPDLDEDTIRKQMEDIINNPKLVYVEPGDNEEIIELIEVLNVH